VFEVLAAGTLTLLQDGGRPGFAHLGVTTSGAADRGASAAANRLVGNEPGACCLEVVFGGLEMGATATALVAVTGATGLVTVITTEFRDGTPGSRVVVHPVGYSFTVQPGDRVTIGAPTDGLRSYLAVRGGFLADRALGSRATDVLSGLGPPPVRSGDVLATADEAAEWPAAEFIPPRLPRHAPVVLQLTRGPRDDYFGDAGWERLLAGRWEVGADSNRVGLRLASAPAAPLVRLAGFERELPSEGMVAGAVQIPPGGAPVVFLRDHPVTGGYPVIGVLTEESIDAAAQLRPGDDVRFTAARR
jgi:biotin-dependent carboxylase-like uncharacterized protein